MSKKGIKQTRFRLVKLIIFIELRSALSGDLGKRELGLLGAVNDTLQHLNLITSKKGFYK